MSKVDPSQQELSAANADLRRRLEEAEEALRAIRNGEVDALVISTPQGEKIYTLKGADHSYRILVETINEGTATLAPDGSILYANTKLAQILRLPLQRVIGSAIRDYISEADRDRFAALISTAGKEGSSDGEFSLRTGNGDPTPVYISLSSLKLEETPGALCLAVADLTRQNRDAALLAEARLCQEILSQAEQPIAVCDETGQVIQASQGLFQLCEKNPLYRPFQEAFPLCFNAKESFPLDPLFQGKTLHNEEVQLPRKNGDPVYLMVNAGPLLGENQEIKGCVVAFTDITARKQAELERQRLIEQLQRSEEELQALNEELMVQTDELQESHALLEQRVEERTAEVAAASERLKYLASQLLTAQERERKRMAMELHDDLGQSLTVLKMQLRQLMKKLNEMPKERERCDESLRFTDGLIEKVRRLSRELSPAALEDLGLSGALDQLFYYFIKFKGLKVTMEKADLKGLFSLEAQTSIYRIFQEALNNISKHSGATWVVVNIQKRDQGIDFHIKDNGQGFDLQELESREGNDRGLGLAAMDERVRILGGELKITSHKYVGTEIVFTIPISLPG